MIKWSRAMTTRERGIFAILPDFHRFALIRFRMQHGFWAELLSLHQKRHSIYHKHPRSGMPQWEHFHKLIHRWQHQPVLSITEPNYITVESRGYSTRVDPTLMCRMITSITQKSAGSLSQLIGSSITGCSQWHLLLFSAHLTHTEKVEVKTAENQSHQ